MQPVLGDVVAVLASGTASTVMAVARVGTRDRHVNHDARVAAHRALVWVSPWAGAPVVRRVVRARRDFVAVHHKARVVRPKVRRAKLGRADNGGH